MNTESTPLFPRTFAMHFEGIDGTFMIVRSAPSIQAAYRLAQELARVRIDCYVRGVTEITEEPEAQS